MGQTVAFYDKYSRGSKDYFTLSREIILAEKGQATSPAASAPASQKTAQARATAAAESPDDVQAFSRKMQALIRDEVAQVKQLIPVTFSYPTPGARSVFVTGSFNDWSLDDNCRLRQVDGRWEAVISLMPGLYKYQFIVDGVWKDDPANPRKERNSFGDINSLIEVKADA